MTQRDEQTRRGRRMLLLLLAVFVVPAAVAWTLFFSGWRPATTSNHGELLDTPTRLNPPELRQMVGPGDDNALDFRGKWTMLMVSRGPCEDACVERLRATRQIRLALAQHTDRAQRVLVLPEGVDPPPEAVLARHRDLYVVAGPTDWVGNGNEALSLSLADTRGYRMMRYSDPFEPSGMLADMKHLLRLSNIDIERLDGLSEQD
ncbi:hypothetical protein [Aquisalimonas sp.]|uniref:hypothetical protein n=1 Tax=Aquisalimonas sp. TaxID=1872621 RepID=UPI0025BBFC74|nr:hypothetical protein [Aquisalimonas sp.]